MTPAQATGHPDFVTDVAVQGPTDPGMRAADCLYARSLPAQPACVDCEGPIPMWARQNMLSGVGDDMIALGGVYVPGYGLAGPNDDVWAGMSKDQQAWVMTALTLVNDKIMKATGSTCATWGPSITAAGSCFKQWFNANYGGKMTGADGKPVFLSPTTVFDQGTLDALITVAGTHQLMPSSYPSGGSSEKKLSTAAMVGIGAAGLGLVGLAIAASRKPRR